VRASQAVSGINKLRVINTNRGNESLPLRDRLSMIQLRDRRQHLSSRNAWSSWFPYTVAGVVTKAPSTSETPQPTRTLLGSRIATESAF
jgi:hypothetical protein